MFGVIYAAVRDAELKLSEFQGANEVSKSDWNEEVVSLKSRLDEALAQVVAANSLTENRNGHIELLLVRYTYTL